MYAIHLLRSSLFCAQAVRRSGESGLISVACRGRSAMNPAPASRMTYLHQRPPGWRGRHVRRSLRLLPERFLLGMQAGELRLSRNACGKARPLRIRLAQQRPARQDTGASPNRVFRPATLTPRRTKTVASPGPLLPPSLKKIGRAAPVGLGYREKKRYRSPLVSL